MVESDELRFIGEVVDEERIDYFIRIFDDYYLVVSNKKFSVRTITAKGLERPARTRDDLNELETFLNENINLESKSFRFGFFGNKLD